MKNTLRFLGLLITIFIAGCGGGSSEPAGKNCVDLPRPTVGLTFIHQKSNLDPNASFHSIRDHLLTETIISSFSDVSMTSTGTSTPLPSDNFSFSFKKELKFTIIDGYQYISFEENTDDLRSLKRLYSPPKKQAIDVVCENQTWTNTYNIESSVTIPGDDISTILTFPDSTIHTIESINESKTVTAGTFTTIRERVDLTGSSAGTTNIIWRDQKTGVIVLRETVSSDNVDFVVGSFELISLF